MKALIEFEYRPKQHYKYWAVTHYRGHEYAVCGDDYADAETRLIDMLQQVERLHQQLIAVPEPKEVEIS